MSLGNAFGAQSCGFTLVHSDDNLGGEALVCPLVHRRPNGKSANLKRDVLMFCSVGVLFNPMASVGALGWFC